MRSQSALGFKHIDFATLTDKKPPLRRSFRPSSFASLQILDCSLHNSSANTTFHHSASPLPLAPISSNCQSPRPKCQSSSIPTSQHNLLVLCQRKWLHLYHPRLFGEGAVSPKPSRLLSATNRVLRLIRIRLAILPRLPLRTLIISPAGLLSSIPPSSHPNLGRPCTA